MRGSVVRRGKKRFALVLNLGYVTDPTTGKRKGKQKWITFHGTKKQAGDKLTELVRAENRGEFVEPTKMTVGEWLRTWLEKVINPSTRRPKTKSTYANIVKNHLTTSAFAMLPLQQVRASDLEQYYASLKAAPATVGVHHTILQLAFKKAVRDRLLTVNPAASEIERPKVAQDHKGAREHCWSAAEARAFLDAAKMAGPQTAAFFVLALDTGARRSELLGLGWSHVDLDGATVTIERQLDTIGAAPTFGPTKTKLARKVSLGAETVTLLRAHKQHQATLKLKNRTVYQDFGLVFAKEPEDLQRPTMRLGQPADTLDRSRYEAVVKAAAVRKIKFHGLRHTSITLLLAAGVPPHVVSKRVGHSKTSMTMDVYAHVLPDQQQDAAAMLGALLHG